MDLIIKKKVLDWISAKITLGYTNFFIDDCIDDIGLNIMNRQDYNTVKEVFDWHKDMINLFYESLLEENT